jgi:hypothetical protein
MGAAVAQADINPGDVYYNPNLTSLVPHYNTSMPMWASGGFADELVASISGDFVGQVTSRVYFLNGMDGQEGLGFTYQVDVEAPPDAGLVRASWSDAWQGLTVMDTGAFGPGSSTSATGATVWSDGKPYWIERDGGGAMAFQLRGVDLSGTVLNGGDESATVWWTVDAPDWRESEVELLDSALSGEAATLVAVPSPGASALGIVGFMAVASLSRRFRRDEDIA